jgi:hypothetical protein
MSKHTPGPWHIIEAESQEGYAELVVTSTHNAVGLDDDVGCFVYGGTDDLQKVKRANARLIAAAPDLLAALEAALPWMMNISVEHGFAADVLDDMRLAIAKAMGTTETL